LDKYEYKVRSEEISNLIEQEKYTEAVKIADTIDWRRVKSASMLLKISVLYRINRRNEEAREVLMLAYERYPANRSVVYSLCELSIELDDVVSAIEYYKQFVKLAPKDNGVFTLRYRILEAQEASLEERIEILEELKKKDYQEEWAYELAYLYHRVGLSTKCVEECDDIILWFGDGPYVMKAMELKAVHVPLSKSQQEKYETMLNHASDNYSDDTETNGSYTQEMDSEEGYEVEDTEYYQDNYADETYESTGYEQENYPQQLYDNSVGYDSQSYQNEGYANSEYDTQGYSNGAYANNEYDTQNYSNGAYANTEYNTQGYPNEGYENSGYDTQGYSNEGYENSGYDTQGYFNEGYENSGYDTQGYSNEGYENSGYDTQGYSNETYENNGYNMQDYSNEAYENSGYDAQGYSNEGYENRGYDNTQGYLNEVYENAQYDQETYARESYNTATFPQESYSDYGQNDYVDDGYANINYSNKNSYTGEFYVEQTYDENGNLIENRNDTNHWEDSGRGKEPDKSYRNGLYLYQSNPAPTANSSDMSQYNTINLQKVVAEGMKEVLADNEDVFAEDREKYNSSEDVNNIVRHTQAYANVQNRGGQESESMAYTNSIAQLVTSVSEAAPAPNTGAIRKVYVPGKDARLIKSDSDIEELRYTTEQSVNEEHNRMENNEENVYHNQNSLEVSGELGAQITGTMNLKDVLAEWERKKTENAKKHQEEIKKRVLTQTGKILADFDNSLKSGILGEIQREEEAAQKRTPRKDRFLEADVTGDIPQNRAKQVSDDAFDVEYRTEQTKGRKEESFVREEYQPELENTFEQELEIAESSEENKAKGDSAYMSQTNEEIWESNDGYETEGDLRDNDKYTLEQDLQDNATYFPEEDLENNTVYLSKEDLEDNAAYFPEENIQNGETSISEQNTEVSAGYTQELNTEDYILEDNIELENGYVEKSNSTDLQADAQDIDVEDGTYYEEDNNEYLLEGDDGNLDGYQANERLDIESDSDAYNDIYQIEENPIEDVTEDYNDTHEIYSYDDSNEYIQESKEEIEIEYADYGYAEDANGYTQELYPEETYVASDRKEYQQNYRYDESELDPEDAESIAEMAKEDALKTQEIKMNTADLSSLSEKIVATTKKEARGAKREELREFTAEEQTLFENFAVTKKIKKQIIFALENMTLTAYTGNVIITGDAGLDTVRMAKNLIKEYQVSDESFSGRLAKITGEKINQRNIKDIFEKLNNGGIIIEKANGMSEEKLYEMALNLNQESLGVVVIMEDTKKEISKLLQKQAMITDYFNIRIDLMEMDNNALVAYAKNYALALEYSIDELGTLALYTRIANMQSGNHVVTKDEVRDIIDEAIWKSRKSKLKNFVDVLFARRYDNEDMIVLKERDFI